MTEGEHDIERAHTLANLRNDMRDLLAAEENNIGTAYLTYRTEFREEELTDEDAAVWEAWKDGMLDMKRFEVWRTKVEQENPASLMGQGARAAFAKVLSNIMMIPPERRAEWLRKVRAKARE